MRAAVVHVIFFFSGIAGLGYQIVWARMFSVGLGHEMPGVLAVVAAFFGGLAVGAWLLDGRVSASPRPGRWYVGLEIVIGGWALLTLALIPWLNVLAAQAIGVGGSPLRHWFVAFAIPFVGLLPATVCMGATFPAMERLVARLRRSGRTVGGLYAANTAGAVAGTLLATYWIIPAFGFRVAVGALAAINGLCAVATAVGPARGEAERPPVVPDAAGAVPVGPLSLVVFMTGLLGIGYEVLGVRVMAQVLENTVYSFASALAMYLVGTAIGGAVYHRFLRERPFVATLTWLLQGLAVACVGGIFVLAASNEIYLSARARFGPTPAGSIAAECVLAAVVFLVPTMIMGALFSHLVQAARRERGGVGRAVGVNTLGAALAPLVFGVVLLPLIGARWALLVVASGYVVLLFVFESRMRRLIPLAVVLPLLVLVPADLVLVAAPEGGRMVAYRDGVMAAVSVVEHPNFGRRLKVNDRFFMGGSAGTFAERRQAHVPLLLHPDPQRVLFLGVGTAITAGASTAHPGTRFTGVELLPEVVDLLPYFREQNELDLVDREETYVVADARRYVRATDDRFDVVIADLFHPARDGSGALYTREHFEAVRERLAEGGIFCQWLPLYQLDAPTLRLVVRTFLDVFPDTTAFCAHFNVETPMLGLVGRTAPMAYPVDWYAARGIDPALANVLVEHLLDTNLDLFGCLLATADELRAFAGTGPLNTDDHPRVTYDAPSFAYRDDRTTYGRLLTLLDARVPVGDSLIEPAMTPDGARFVLRLNDYLAARDVYLRGMCRLRAGDEEAAWPLLLESVRTSPDFNAGYVFCLAESRNRRPNDRALARRLLRGLVEARPEDPRAANDLRRHFGE
jgi:spermidine synthase